MADLHRVIKVGILTVSDTCYNGKAEDKSGENLKKLVESGKCFKGTVTTKDIIHDEQEDIKAKLLHWSDNLKLDVILTTGGTGFSPRDVTPEATKSVITKEALGMTVAMIKGSLDITPLAMLSRLVCGIRGSTLIINLPGSTKGSAECLEIVSGSIPHAVDLLHSNQSNVQMTHTTLQAEGIKSVHSTHSVHSSDSEDTSFGGYKNMQSRISNSPNLLKHLRCDESEHISSTEDRLSQFIVKLTEFLEKLVTEMVPSQCNIDCHMKESGRTQSNEWIGLIMKFVQVLLFPIQDSSHSLGIPEKFNSPSLLSKRSKAIESELKSLIDYHQQIKYDRTSVSIPIIPDNKVLKRGSSYNKVIRSAKSVISQEAGEDNDDYLHISSLMYQPSGQNESQACKSSSCHGISECSKQTTSSSPETELYNKSCSGIALSSNSFVIPHSHKTFHQCPVRNQRTDNSSTKVNGTESVINSRILASPNHVAKSNGVSSRENRHLQQSVRELVQINLPTYSKQLTENSSIENDKDYLCTSSDKSKREEISVSANSTLGINDLSKQDSSVLSRMFEKDVINMSYKCNSQVHNSSVNDNFLNVTDFAMDNGLCENKRHLCLPSFSMNKSNISSSTISASTPTPVLSSSSRALGENSHTTITSNKPHFGNNTIMSAKIHNMNNNGELVHVPVGKAFNCFVNDHHLLKGISLYKGKRDIKKLLVYLTRQEDVTLQATTWKRGKEVLERNRLDDYFQLTVEGMKEQNQVHCGKKRDQYVVNWYMWCPGHGNCKRKCGGYGKCVENCKGMLHKQDRHNCSLMVNLKLFLSDLTMWRVHITGSHAPDQDTSSNGGTEQHPLNYVGISHKEPSSQTDDLNALNSNGNDKPALTVNNHRGHTDMEAYKGQSVSKESCVTAVDKCIQMPSFAQTPSSIDNENSLFCEKDHDFHFQQSKIPSKKRISKMLSSLKRRRQNKPCGLLKSRPSNSNHSCENEKEKSSVSNQYAVSSNAHEIINDTSHLGPTPGFVPTTTLNNQSLLLSEFSSYLPEIHNNEHEKRMDNEHEKRMDNAVISEESISDLNHPISFSYGPKTSAVLNISNTTTTTTYSDAVNVEKYNVIDKFSTYVKAMPDTSRENMEIDKEDTINHSSLPIPDFHQPFLHANSLTEILTEAGVNISEQFDDLNSSINLGIDSSLSEIERMEATNKYCLPFHSSQQLSLEQTSSFFSNDENLVRHHATNDSFESSITSTSVDALPTYREAAFVLAKQKDL